MMLLTHRPTRIVAATLLSGTALLASSATDQRHTAPAHRAQSVSLGSLRVRLVRAGRGTPVVLIHGYGESLMSWRALFDELSHHADVTAVDLPGFGLSSKPEHGYSADSMALSVLQLLDQLGLGRVVLVGHSLGGAVAAAVAVLAPERVLGLVLVDPALVTPPLLAGSLDSAGEMERVRGLVVAYYQSLRSRFAGIHDPDWLAESAAAATYEPARDPAYFRALVAVLAQFDFQHLTRERAARLTMPTLLVWGAQDPVVPAAYAQGLLAMLPRARLEIVPRSWHRPHSERPREVVGLIEGFLDEIGTANQPRAH
jgi:pimeloyl-ACP methyl ester carboxylesterase